MASTRGNPGRRSSPVTIRDVEVPCGDSPVDARSYVPEGQPRAGILWVHGGSFIEGDLNMSESHEVSRALAGQGIWVLATDYRKATGGVTFPAPVDDVEASWNWFVGEAGHHGVSPSALHLGGASAGACLAASVALRVRDRGPGRPRALVLAYPLLHPSIPRLDQASADRIAAIPGATEFSPEQIIAMALNYVGDPSLLSSSDAFPGLASLPELAGLPATLIITSEHDSLRTSGERFHADLLRAGVPSEHHTEHGTVHGHLGGVGSAGFERSVDRIVQWVQMSAPNRDDR